MEEVQEARRIKMMHQPCKVCQNATISLYGLVVHCLIFLSDVSVGDIPPCHSVLFNIVFCLMCSLLPQVMDMEHELRALRLQLREKSIFSAKLQKEVCFIPFANLLY